MNRTTLDISHVKSVQKQCCCFRWQMSTRAHSKYPELKSLGLVEGQSYNTTFSAWVYITTLPALGVVESRPLGLCAATHSLELCDGSISAWSLTMYCLTICNQAVGSCSSSPNFTMQTPTTRCADCDNRLHLAAEPWRGGTGSTAIAHHSMLMLTNNKGLHCRWKAANDSKQGML